MVRFQTYWKILHGLAQPTLLILLLLLTDGWQPRDQHAHPLLSHDSLQKNRDFVAISENLYLELDDDP